MRIRETFQAKGKGAIKGKGEGGIKSKIRVNMCDRGLRCYLKVKERLSSELRIKVHLQCLRYKFRNKDLSAISRASK